MKKYVMVLLFLTFAIASFNGCGGDDVNGDSEKHDYVIYATMVQDMNRTGTLNYFYADLWRDSLVFGNADILINDTVLSYTFSPELNRMTYGFTQTLRAYRSGGSYMVTVADSTFFEDTVSNNLPDSIYILNYNPDSSTTYNPNDGSFVLDWTSSLNIEGYVLATVPADSAYTGFGYSKFVTSLTNAGTIPPDAFQSPNDTGIFTGTYYFYVYGFTGAADKNIADHLLPVPFPAQLADNISHDNLSGHIGSIIVSRRVPIDVVASK